jgi:hypothetical protein
LTLLLKFINYFKDINEQKLVINGIASITTETVNRIKGDVTKFITDIQNLGKRNAVVRNVSIGEVTDPIKIFINRVEQVVGKDMDEYQQFIQSILTYLQFIANIMNSNDNWEKVPLTIGKIAMFLAIQKIGNKLPLMQLGGHVIKKYMPKRRKQFQMT